MANKRIKVVIDKRGGIRAIWKPELDQIIPAEAHRDLRRASHVEPTQELSQQARENLRAQGMTALPPNLWWADMAPVGGPVLGPYVSREKALEEEVLWLEGHGIPAPRRPRKRFTKTECLVLVAATVAIVLSVLGIAARIWRVVS